jgi:histidinol-phosphate aminotransferase
MSYFRLDLVSKKQAFVDVPHKKTMMCLNESTLNPFLEIKNELLKKLESLPLNRYFNDITGELEKKLADYAGVRQDMIVFGNGADDILYSIFLAVRDNNDSFAVSVAPSYFDYKSYSGAVGLNIKFLSLQPDFDFSKEDYLTLCNHPNCKLAILCQPNNPTGNLFDMDKLLAIIKSLPCLVLVDETYFEFSGKTFVSYLEKLPNLIIVRSFSKAFSVAGLRFGYAISSPENIYELKKVFTAFHVSLLTQAFAVTILENKDRFLQHTVHVIQLKNTLYAEMKRLPDCIVHNTSTNFIIFSTGKKTLDLYHYLSEQDIAVRNVGAHPILENYLRVSIGTEDEISLFLDKVKTFLGGKNGK